MFLKLIIMSLEKKESIDELPESIGRVAYILDVIASYDLDTAAKFLASVAEQSKYKDEIPNKYEIFKYFDPYLRV